MAQTSRVLTDPLQRLRLHMDIPIDRTIRGEEAALEEEAIVKGRRSRGGIGSLKTILTDELVAVNGYIKYADANSLGISTIVEYLETLEGAN